MPRRRPNPDVIALLERLLVEARAAELTRIFTVIGYCDGSYTHDYATDDFDDTLLQVRTEVIVAQSGFDHAITQH